MIIDFREISDAGLSVETDEPLVWLDDLASDPLRRLYQFPQPFHVKVRLHKSASNVFIEGRYSGAAEAQCVRCLRSFQVAFDEPLKLTLLPLEPLRPTPGGNERELQADDLDLAYYDQEQVDLGKMVAEQIILSLDLYPHCRPDCQGLCSQCGVNLNEMACRCQQAQSDERWAALKQLRIAKGD